MQQCESTTLNGPSGKLEVLYSLPIVDDDTLETETDDPTTAAAAAAGLLKPPVLFIHGTFCSAHDFQNFLPYLAQHGYPAYALSLRGHGASQKQRWLRKMFFTNLHSWAADVRCVLAHMTKEAAASRMSVSSSSPSPSPSPPASSASSSSASMHSASPPPSIKSTSSSCNHQQRHSLGGGVLQWMLSSGAIGRHHQDVPTEISGLVLLGSMPLSGSGREVLSNWERAEASRGALRRPFMLSERCLVRTRTQARAAFFSDETEDAVVETWLRTCKTKHESALAGMSVLWPFGEAAKVLGSLSGIGLPPRGKGYDGRKVLCVAGSVDKLVPPAMVLANAYAYADAVKEAGEGLETCRMWTVQGSGHHLMMDAHWQECADGVLRWLEGEELPTA
ncbi:alpha/beta-hydrolase [Apiospora saccharicola]